MNKLHTKEPYQVPQVRVVEFRMEHGFAGSSTLSVPGINANNGSDLQHKAASTFGTTCQDWN